MKSNQQQSVGGGAESRKFSNASDEGKQYVSKKASISSNSSCSSKLSKRASIDSFKTPSDLHRSSQTSTTTTSLSSFSCLNPKKQYLQRHDFELDDQDDQDENDYGEEEEEDSPNNSVNEMSGDEYSEEAEDNEGSDNDSLYNYEQVSAGINNSQNKPVKQIRSRKFFCLKFKKIYDSSFSHVFF